MPPDDICACIMGKDSHISGDGYIVSDGYQVRISMVNRSIGVDVAVLSDRHTMRQKIFHLSLFSE